MRKDLMHWDQALKLAKTLAPMEVPEISQKFAKHLEFRGEFQLALTMYEKGLIGKPGSEHDQLCSAGMARMYIRLGDITRGLKLATQSNSKQLCRECGDILENMKQFQDAALMFEKGEQFEKAATIHIRAKDFPRAKQLLNQINTPKLHREYAKAMEAVKSYQEAVVSYERANDMDSVVRLNLDVLDNAQRAFAIVRKTQSVSAAHMVAKHCIQQQDFKSAIEFLLIAKQNADALELAKEHDDVDTYTLYLGKDGTPEEYLDIAQYYESSKGLPERAGEFYLLCQQYHKALKLFLQCGERALDGAIQVVGLAKNDMLTHTLIDYLMGESDGVPKDPNYIFRLYMALGNFPQAAKTAVIIARQEQELGNYKVAHTILFDTHKDLEAQQIRVPQELYRNLLLLHSYILVKVLVKQGEHLAGAWMLIRVAKNISKFPSHIVPILTSTVIECHRSGLKRSAFDYASMLMRPEYRSQIAPQYKRRIEAIVRKPDKSAQDEEGDEEVTPCPNCNTMLPATQLDCPSCKNAIPYCIATGKHMVFDDWCVCPSCRFPALYSAFTKLIDEEKCCPMCTQTIVPTAIQKIPDPTSFLKKAIEIVKDGDD
jgi:WD repeat-containing protein 19